MDIYTTTELASLTIQQSSENKDLILNFLLAITALSGTLISSYFIKRAGISMNAFNFIRRKVFRDQNRLGTQLHKNRDREFFLKTKIQAIIELRANNPVQFDSLVLKKIGKAANQKSLQKDLLKLEKRKLLLDIVNVLSDIDTKFNDQQDSSPYKGIDKNIQTPAKELKVRAFAEINLIAKSNTRDKTIKSELLNILKRKDIHLIYKDMCVLKGSSADVYTTELSLIYKEIESNPAFVKKYNEKSALKLFEKVGDFNKQEYALQVNEISKELKEIGNLVSNTLVDMDQAIEFFNIYVFGKKGKESFIERFANYFYEDFKSTIFKNKMSDSQERVLNKNNKLSKIDFKDVVGGNNESFDTRIKGLNRKNNEFDYYDLQISDQIQISRIYKEIMTSRELEKRGAK